MLRKIVTVEMSKEPTDNKSVAVSAAVPPEIAKRLSTLASEMDRPLAELINVAILRLLEEEEELVASVKRALAKAATGEGYTTDELLAEPQRLRNSAEQ